MLDFNYVKMVKSGTIFYQTYNDISIESFKKLIDKICISGQLKYPIVIKTSIKMMHIVNILGLATKRYNIRENYVIGIMN